MRNKLLVAGLVLVVPMTALHAMSVATFLEKAERLERRGAMAVLSSDMGLLKNEARSATAQLREERLAAQRAGRRPAYCPPEAGGSLNPREILDHFRAIPAAQRERMHLRDGMRSLLARKFPCPA